MRRGRISPHSCRHIFGKFWGKFFSGEFWLWGKFVSGEFWGVPGPGLRLAAPQIHPSLDLSPDISCIRTSIANFTFKRVRNTWNTLLSLPIQAHLIFGHFLQTQISHVLKLHYKTSIAGYFKRAVSTKATLLTLSSQCKHFTILDLTNQGEFPNGKMLKMLIYFFSDIQF